LTRALLSETVKTVQKAGGSIFTGVLEGVVWSIGNMVGANKSQSIDLPFRRSPPAEGISIKAEDGSESRKEIPLSPTSDTGDSAGVVCRKANSEDHEYLDVSKTPGAVGGVDDNTANYVGTGAASQKPAVSADVGRVIDEEWDDWDVSEEKAGPEVPPSGVTSLASNSFNSEEVIDAKLPDEPVTTESGENDHPSLDTEDCSESLVIETNDELLNYNPMHADFVSPTEAALADELGCSTGCDPVVDGLVQIPPELPVSVPECRAQDSIEVRDSGFPLGVSAGPDSTPFAALPTPDQKGAASVQPSSEGANSVGVGLSGTTNVSKGDNPEEIVLRTRGKGRKK
jgi:hypothetical protein